MPLGPAPLLLDGGLATALEDAGHDVSGSLWSARLLRDDPAAIADAHRAFFRAGADVAITASYQVSYDGFEAAGMARDVTSRLLRRSVALAREARTAEGQLVAASIGPYGAALADGSEYRGYGDLPARTLRDFHERRLHELLAAEPDLLAIETIPDLAEAEVLVALLDELGDGEPGAWLSFTIDGDRTRAGQPLADAFAVANGCDRVVAVGVNCSAPGDVPGALRLVAEATDRPGIAYPNSGEGWDAEARGWTGAACFAGADVRAWVELGALFVGGCCRVGVADIAELAAALNDE